MSETAYFAAGCFWGIEETFRRVEGVLATRVGYTGGEVADPSYEQVCTGQTGHAEAVEVQFDPALVSYEKLLDVFWAAHDPTQKNRQGPDVGTQYRSAIFVVNDEQRQAAEKSRAKLEASGKLNRPIATQIVDATPFYPAEAYHQQYIAKGGRGACATTIREQ